MRYTLGMGGRNHKKKYLLRPVIRPMLLVSNKVIMSLNHRDHKL